jgi:multiple sugar transport system substrate-binding protein
MEPACQGRTVPNPSPQRDQTAVIGRRRLARLALLSLGATTIAPLVTACGGPAASATVSPTTSTAMSIAAPPPSGVATRLLLRLNGLEAPAQRFANEFVADYGRQHGVAVEIDHTDWLSSFGKITTGIAGGIAPDVFMAGAIWIAALASKQALLPLDGLVRGWSDWPDWYEACRRAATYAGVTYGVPYQVVTRGNLIYRKGLFEQAGLNPAAPPRTWDEALTTAHRLTQRQDGRITISGWHIRMSAPDLAQQYEDALVQAGGTVFTDDLTAPRNATPEGEAALRFLVSFVERGILPPEGMDTGLANLNAYTAGRVALFPGFPWDLLNAQIFAPAVWDETLVAPPLHHKQQSGTLEYLIYQRTKSPEASFRLIQALVGEQAGVELGIEGVWAMPARKAHERAKVLADPRLRTCVESLRLATPRQVVPQHFDVQPAMGRHVELALRGAMPVAEALRAMDAAVTTILRGG